MLPLCIGCVDGKDEYESHTELLSVHNAHGAYIEIFKENTKCKTFGIRRRILTKIRKTEWKGVESLTIYSIEEKEKEGIRINKSER